MSISSPSRARTRSAHRQGAAAPRRGRGATGRVAAVLCALLGVALLAGCAGTPKPRKACAIIYASGNLNLYDGEPHPITVWVYPLSGPTAFQQTSVERLLEGSHPDDVLAAPIPITISPNEKHKFKEVFPARTRHLGLLADYYRAPGDPQGSRSLVVPARCGLFRKPKVVLSPKDIYEK